MALGLRKSFVILAPGSSLRRRVAYSLAIVRLVLVQDGGGFSPRVSLKKVGVLNKPQDKTATY